MKSWLVTLLFVAFGMGQVSCACVAGTRASTEIGASVQSHDAQAAHASKHCASDQKAAEPSRNPPVDCDHCKTSSVAKSNVPFEFIGAPVAPALMAGILPASLARPMALALLSPETFPRCRTGPPGRTLVTLKIKILN